MHNRLTKNVVLNLKKIRFPSDRAGYKHARGEQLPDAECAIRDAMRIDWDTVENTLMCELVLAGFAFEEIVGRGSFMARYQGEYQTSDAICDELTKLYLRGRMALGDREARAMANGLKQQVMEQAEEMLRTGR